MKRTRILFAGLLAVAPLPALTGCASHLTEEERTERLERRLDRRQDAHRERMRRRAIRARSQDERYHDWWNAMMGRGGYQ